MKEKSKSTLTLYITSLFVSLVVLLLGLVLGFKWLQTQKANRYSPNVLYEHKSTAEENLTILYMSCQKQGDIATNYQLIHYDSPRNTIYTFALPKELLCTVPTQNSDKTATLYEQYDYQSTSGAVMAVENATGIKIDKYIRTSSDGISGLLYNIGSIPCDVPESVAQNDLGLSQGLQSLDGYMVSQFAFNEDVSPEEKLTMQNEFFKATLNQVFFSNNTVATEKFDKATPPKGEMANNPDEITTPFGETEKNQLTVFYQALFNYTETNITQLDIQFREKSIEKLFLDNESVNVIDLNFDFSQDTVTLSDKDRTVIDSIVNVE